MSFGKRLACHCWVMCLWMLVAVSCDSITLWASEPDEQEKSSHEEWVLVNQDEVAMDTVVVTATRMTSTLEQTPMAVSILDSADFRRPAQGLGLDEWLNEVPGVFFQNRYNFAQNLRISTRGFGARAAFGVRGIQLRVDGFPETLPDGQAQTDAIDLQSLQGAEVIRGPSSLQYGNASGGVLALQTEDGQGKPLTTITDFSVGGDGFQSIGLQAGQDGGRWHGWLSAMDVSYGGQRQHAATDKRMLHAHGGIRFVDQGHLRLVISVLDQPFGEDPGALTREQVNADRWQASAQSQSLNAGQTVRQERMGLVFDSEGTLSQRWSLYAFNSNRDFEQQLPSSFFPSLIAYQRDFSGLGATWQWSGLDDVTLTLGSDWARQRDNRQRYSVDRQANITGQTQNERQIAQSSALFGQLSGQWAQGSWLAGIRIDDLDLSIAERSLVANPPADRRFDQWSGMVGLTVALGQGVMGFANISNGFESPTFTEIKDLSGTGGFARSLQPAKAMNYELGVRGDWRSTRGEANVFWIETADEIVVIDSFDGVDLYGNAGKTDRLGFELGLDHEWSERLSMTMAYTYGRYRFEQFSQGGQSFAGNVLPGLPRHSLAAKLGFELSDRWSVYADGLWVSSMYADNANEEPISGYGLVNTQLEYVLSNAKGRSLIWSFGVNNAFNQPYFSNVRINANRGAYFEPGPSRAWYSRVRYQFGPT